MTTLKRILLLTTLISLMEVKYKTLSSLTITLNFTYYIYKLTRHQINQSYFCVFTSTTFYFFPLSYFKQKNLLVIEIAKSCIC